MSPNTITRLKKARAFSLVEVVLALGLLSFALIPMLAMIGGGLQTYRYAAHDMISRQIMTQLATDAQQSPQADLLSAPAITSYYDVEGNPVDSASSPDRVYTATVETQQSMNPLSSGSLIRVRIRVQGLEADSLQQTSLQVFPQS